MNPPEWPDVENLIYKWAGKFSANTPIDIEELASEGRLAYAEALVTWNPEKGAFSTHLVWKLRWFMGRYVGKEFCAKGENRQSTIRTSEDDEEAIEMKVPQSETFIERLLAELGSDAREIVATVLDGKTVPIKKGIRKATNEIRTALRALKYS